MDQQRFFEKVGKFIRNGRWNCLVKVFDLCPRPLDHNNMTGGKDGGVLMPEPQLQKRVAADNEEQLVCRAKLPQLIEGVDGVGEATSFPFNI